MFDIYLFTRSNKITGLNILPTADGPAGVTLLITLTHCFVWVNNHSIIIIIIIIIIIRYFLHSERERADAEIKVPSDENTELKGSPFWDVVNALSPVSLKPGVGQYVAMHATLTARDFFLANFYHSGPFTCIFVPKPLPIISCVVSCC